LLRPLSQNKNIYNLQFPFCPFPLSKLHRHLLWFFALPDQVEFQGFRAACVRPPNFPLSRDGQQLVKYGI